MKSKREEMSVDMEILLSSGIGCFVKSSVEDDDISVFSKFMSTEFVPTCGKFDKDESVQSSM